MRMIIIIIVITNRVQVTRPHALLERIMSMPDVPGPLLEKLQSYINVCDSQKPMQFTHIVVDHACMQFIVDHTVHACMMPSHEVHP